VAAEGSFEPLRANACSGDTSNAKAIASSSCGILNRVTAGAWNAQN